MKNILLLSDTHNHIHPNAYEYIHAADEVWHAGDIGTVAFVDELAKHKPFRAVYGNIDDAQMRTIYPKDLVFTCEGVKVYMTHIGGYPNRYNLEAKKIIEQERPQLFICGHSHILKVMPDKKYNLLHMNPGAVGNHGFHNVITMLRFQIHEGVISNLAVIELGARG
jgi:putative phosphoesterase